MNAVSDQIDIKVLILYAYLYIHVYKSRYFVLRYFLHKEAYMRKYFYVASFITQLKCLNQTKTSVFLLIASGRPSPKSDDNQTLIYIQERAHAGNTTQSIHPPLMQMTHIHIKLHTLHQLNIYKFKIHETPIKQRWG